MAKEAVPKIIIILMQIAVVVSASSRDDPLLGMGRERLRAEECADGVLSH